MSPSAPEVADSGKPSSDDETMVLEYVVGTGGSDTRSEKGEITSVDDTTKVMAAALVNDVVAVSVEYTSGSEDVPAEKTNSCVKESGTNDIAPKNRNGSDEEGYTILVHDAVSTLRESIKYEKTPDHILTRSDNSCGGKI